jgi:tetratricopeptide (TPR) repeat protein
VSHYDKGVILYQQRRFDLAEAEFRKALSEHPEAHYAHAMLAAALAAQGHSERGIKEAQIAIKLAPEFAYAHYILSLSQLASGRAGEAEKTIKEALRLDPISPTYLNHAGEIALAKGDCKTALKYAEEGLQEDPEDVECINTRAQALVRLGRFLDADQSLDTALRLSPQDSMTHSNKGWVLVRNGRIEESIEHFKEALRLNPNSEWAYEGVVEALKARNPLYHFMLMGSLSLQEMSSHVRSALWWFCWVIPPLRALLIFALIATFCTKTIFTFLLRLDPLGRRVLADTTKRENNWAMAVVVLIVGAIMFCVFDPNALYPETHATAIKARNLFIDGKKAEAMQLWNSIIERARVLDGRSQERQAKTVSGSPGHRRQVAQETLEDLIDTLGDINSADPDFIFKCMMELGHHYVKCGEFYDAERAYADASSFAEKVPSKKNHAIAQAHEGMAIAAKGSSQHYADQAVETFEPAIEQLEQEIGSHDPTMRSLLAEFVAILSKSNHVETAKAFKRKLDGLDAAELGASELGARIPTTTTTPGSHK